VAGDRVGGKIFQAFGVFVLQYVQIFVRHEAIPERGCPSRSAFDFAIDPPTFDNPPRIQSAAAGQPRSVLVAAAPRRVLGG